MARLKKDKAIQTKVLDALDRCCKKMALSQVSMRDIAAEAGISHTNIYYYYPNKHQILLSYIKYWTQIYLDAAKEMFSIYNGASINDFIEDYLNLFFGEGNGIVASRTFIQIYAMGLYDQEIHQEISSFYDVMIESIMIALKGIQGFTYSKENAERILLITEGLLVFSVNKNITREDASQYLQLADLFQNTSSK